MRQDNQTSIREFVLLGFSREQGINILLFTLVLCMYLITLAGNTLIIVATCIDPRLNTPMYFFLSNLSFLDICYTTSVVPQLLVHSLSIHKKISFIRCMTQLYVAFLLGTTEFILLAVMAYDRYTAVCHPLHYKIIMSRKVCIQLMMVSWISGFTNALVHTLFTLCLHYCSYNVVNHFGCDVLAIIKLACSDTFVNDIALMVSGVLVLFIPCILVMLSYVYIIRTIMSIRSAEGQKRAFSTCISHLTVVILCYGTAVVTYMTPKTDNSSNRDKILSFLYAVVTPMLNPLIYSLRNKEVKGALTKIALRKNILLEGQ
ncbi:olfactory receptor-like protein OLF3 [Sphaerodactylus townsendi]|uniref:olfactory receptor-like protein OLF3 n=1 Tax=Sphaerodactylus townsendi TaxID=933632 RepID=UPI0020263F88|nr:olfactory receptor-like protein OLF3 [Sphaerodactylus townsendi]